MKRSNVHFNKIYLTWIWSNNNQIEALRLFILTQSPADMFWNSVSWKLSIV